MNPSPAAVVVTFGDKAADSASRLRSDQRRRLSSRGVLGGAAQARRRSGAPPKSPQHGPRETAARDTALRDELNPSFKTAFHTKRNEDLVVEAMHSSLGREPGAPSALEYTPRAELYGPQDPSLPPMVTVFKTKDGADLRAEAFRDQGRMHFDADDTPGEEPADDGRPAFVTAIHVERNDDARARALREMSNGRETYTGAPDAFVPRPTLTERELKAMGRERFRLEHHRAANDEELGTGRRAELLAASEHAAAVAPPGTPETVARFFGDGYSAAAEAGAAGPAPGTAAAARVAVARAREKERRARTSGAAGPPAARSPAAAAERARAAEERRAAETAAIAALPPFRPAGTAPAGRHESMGTRKPAAAAALASAESAKAAAVPERREALAARLAAADEELRAAKRSPPRPEFVRHVHVPPISTARAERAAAGASSSPPSPLLSPGGGGLSAAGLLRHRRRSSNKSLGGAVPPEAGGISYDLPSPGPRSPTLASPRQPVRAARVPSVEPAGAGPPAADRLRRSPKAPAARPASAARRSRPAASARSMTPRQRRASVVSANGGGSESGGARTGAGVASVSVVVGYD